MGFSGNGGSITYLVHDSLLRLMEDGMPVGGDNIGVDSKFLHELVDTFTEKLSIGAVESDELQSLIVCAPVPNICFMASG